MYTSQGQDNWVKQLMISGFFVGTCCAVVWGVSLLIGKSNDDQKTRLTQNNLQLVRDNRELRNRLDKVSNQLIVTNERLSKFDKCLRQGGFK